MSKLKTINYPGHSYFISLKVVNHIKIFTDNKYCQILIDNLNFYRRKYRFKLFGYVIMPNHVHLIILPCYKDSIDSVGSEEPTFSGDQPFSEGPTFSGDQPFSEGPVVLEVEEKFDSFKFSKKINFAHSENTGSLEPVRTATISDIIRDFKKYSAIQIIKQLKIDKKTNILKIFEYRAQHYYLNNHSLIEIDYQED